MFRATVTVSSVTALLMMIAASTAAQAGPINQPPPSGTVIYQLTGQTISTNYQQATATFVANTADTVLAFALREDPDYLLLSNVSMVDQTASGTNLLLNGDFSLGPTGASAPTDWTYLNIFGAGAGGTIATGCGYGGGACYRDGAVQAYDGISQVVATTIGDTYQVSFWYAASGGSGTYQPVSTNGDVTSSSGNGRDLFVYASAGLPVAAPEPGALFLLATGIAGLGFVGRRRRRVR